VKRGTGARANLLSESESESEVSARRATGATRPRARPARCAAARAAIHSGSTMSEFAGDVDIVINCLRNVGLRVYMS
jgi:hypothetical protein